MVTILGYSIKEQLYNGYHFLHDCVQQAAYSLVSDDLKESTHTRIGKLLLANTPTYRQDEKIFDIVNQLNHGIDSLKSDREKEELIRLNIKAGQKAKESTAYAVASYHFELCIKLLTATSWNTRYHNKKGLAKGLPNHILILRPHAWVTYL